VALEHEWFKKFEVKENGDDDEENDKDEGVALDNDFEELKITEIG